MKRYLIGAALALLAGCAAAQTTVQLSEVLVIVKTGNGLAVTTAYAVPERPMLYCYTAEFPLPAEVTCLVFTGARFTEGPLELEPELVPIFAKPAGT